VLQDVSMDSSPGVPYMGLGVHENSELFERYREAIKEAVWERIVLLATRDLVHDNVKAVDLVKGGYCDPVRIFVKNEPHNQLKVQQGRLRLISSVSLVDQLVERLLMSQQNKAEIDAWIHLPSKPGLGLDDPSLERIVAYVKPWKGTLYEADVSGWDFGMQWWEMHWEANIRAKLAGMEGKLYHRIMVNRVWCEANSLFMLSDGGLVAQTVPGKRCSGSYNTSAGNSRVRVMLGYLVGSQNIMAMGDDSVEEGTPEARDAYERLGHIIKTFAESKDGFEFCSMRIRDTNGKVTGEPVNWTRTFFRLLYATSDYKARLFQFRYEMRHSPYLLLCERLLERVRWGSSNHAQEDCKEAQEVQGESQEDSEGCGSSDEGGQDDRSVRIRDAGDGGETNCH